MALFLAFFYPSECLPWPTIHCKNLLSDAQLCLLSRLQC